MDNFTDGSAVEGGGISADSLIDLIISANAQKSTDGAVEYIIRSVDGRVSYTVSGTVEIGRKHELSRYLESKRFVSRRHAALTLEDGALYVIDVGNADAETGKNLGSTNGTYINGKRIPKFRKVQLHDKDILSLGGRESDVKRPGEAAHFVVIEVRK